MLVMTPLEGERAPSAKRGKARVQVLGAVREPEENMSGGAVMRSLIRLGAGRVCHTSCQHRSARGRLTSAADGPTFPQEETVPGSEPVWTAPRTSSWPLQIGSSSGSPACLELGTILA